MLELGYFGGIKIPPKPLLHPETRGLVNNSIGPPNNWWAERIGLNAGSMPESVEFGTDRLDPFPRLLDHRGSLREV